MVVNDLTYHNEEKPELMRGGRWLPMQVTQWEGTMANIWGLIHGLRMELAPGQGERDWEQVGCCQRLITTFEPMVKASEFLGKWMGDPETSIIRLTEELQRLNEKWTEGYIKRLAEIKHQLLR
jgi:hypothetical protein